MAGLLCKILFKKTHNQQCFMSLVHYKSSYYLRLILSVFSTNDSDDKSSSDHGQKITNAGNSNILAFS